MSPPRRLVAEDVSGVDGLPVVAFASRGDWEEWLGREHARAGGVWLKIAKKNGVVFVDLFHPTQKLYSTAEKPLTINGVY